MVQVHVPARVWGFESLLRHQKPEIRDLGLALSADRFRARTLGMAVARQMAKSGMNADAFRAACSERVASAANVSLRDLTADERHAFGNLALALDAGADLRAWTPTEKARLVQVVRAKMADEEWGYLRLMREHPRLRQAIIRLGSD